MILAIFTPGEAMNCADFLCMLMFMLTILWPYVVQGFWSTLKSAADDRPWLWALYVVVLLLPIILLSICLCPKSGPIKVNSRLHTLSVHETTLAQW